MLDKVVPAIFIVTILLFSAGCQKKADQNGPAAAAGFKADPSKMTAEQRQKMQDLMRNSGKPPAGASGTR